MIHWSAEEEAWPVRAWVEHLLSAKATTSLRDCQTVGHGPLEAGGRRCPEGLHWEAGGVGRSSH